MELRAYIEQKIRVLETEFARICLCRVRYEILLKIHLIRITLLCILQSQFLKHKEYELPERCCGSIVDDRRLGVLQFVAKNQCLSSINKYFLKILTISNYFSHYFSMNHGIIHYKRENGL